MNTSTVVRPRIEIDALTGEPRRSHLVPPRGRTPGHAVILEARVFGLPVEALCGVVLVPSRDPRNFPDCSRCLEIFKVNTGAEDGWIDA